MSRMMNRGGQQSNRGGRGADRSKSDDTASTGELQSSAVTATLSGETLSDEESVIVSEILSAYDAENLTEEDILAIQAAVQGAIEAGTLEPGRALAEAVREQGFDPRELFPRGRGRSAPEESELSEEQIEIVSGILANYDADTLSDEDISAIQAAFQSAVEAGDLVPNRTLAETVAEYGFDPAVLFPHGRRHAAPETAEESTTTEVESYLSGDDTVEDSEEFNIEVNFLGEWDSTLVDAVTNAADFLSDLISNNTALVEGVADLTIDIAMMDMDGEGGALGSSSVTDTWGDSYTPSESLIEFDAADAASYYEQGLWDDIVLHEMIHSLGFGTVWQNEGIVEVSTDESGAVVAEYSGESASELEPTDADAPVVETDGGTGTAYGHWDEETYDNELMTGTIDESNYISDMTYGALEDLGYEIDYTIDVSNYLGIDSEASLTAATSSVTAESTASVSVDSGEMLMVADILDLGEGNLIFAEEVQTESSETASSKAVADDPVARDFGPMQFNVEDLVGQPLAIFAE